MGVVLVQEFVSCFSCRCSHGGKVDLCRSCAQVGPSMSIASCVPARACTSMKTRFLLSLSSCSTRSLKRLACNKGCLLCFRCPLGKQPPLRIPVFLQLVSISRSTCVLACSSLFSFGFFWPWCFIWIHR